MGRPLKDISPTIVEELASQGCTKVEIAEHFGVDRQLIHARFHTEYANGRARLKSSLRRDQIRAAKKGNAAMLIFLGKQYLGQSDRSIDEFLIDAIENAGLTKEDLLELIQNRDAMNLRKPVKSFSEFCVDAGYPAPFDKQIEMMHFGFHETDARVLLGARGYGKTDYLTVLGTGYELYVEYMQGNPLSTSLIITKSKERNAAMLREIQSACMKSGVVFERANATHLRVKGLHGKDHSVSAVTIGTTTLRGRHPKRTIMDDPVTEDDTSEATRLHARRVLNEVMKLSSNVLIIGQPAHQYDLYADVRGQIKTMEVPYGSIPALDPDLDAQRIAGVSENSISMSYHLKVIPEGASPFAEVKYLDSFPVGESVAFIDPSEGGDYTAVSILRGHFDGVAIVGFAWKKAWHDCFDDFREIFARFHVQKIAFETNCTGEMPIEILRQRIPGIGVVGRRANNNKHSRIMGAGAFASSIHLSRESHRIYLDHVVKYEYGAKFDDAPDSLASCMEWVGMIRGKR